jgi:hypothetical protein
MRRVEREHIWLPDAQSKDGATNDKDRACRSDHFREIAISLNKKILISCENQRFSKCRLGYSSAHES